MLIKSQDGDVIVNTNTLVSLYVCNSKIRCTTTHSNDDCGFVMGKYDTDYYAQVALDKLFESINEPKYDLGGEKK